METHKDIPIKSYEALSRHEPVVLDNSCIAEYKKCPKRYFFRVVLGYTEVDNPPYFSFGSAYHKFREVLDNSYNKLRINNIEPKEARIQAQLEATNSGLEYWIKDTNNKNPEPGSKFDFLTKERLLKSFLKMSTWWENERKSGNIKVLHTEQPFNVVLPNGQPFGGRIDRLESNNGRLWVRDYKTSSKEDMFYSRTIEPNAQFPGYAYASSQLHGKNVDGVLVEVLYNRPPLKTNRSKKTKDEQAAHEGPTPKVYTVSTSEYKLSKWLKDIIHWTNLIKQSRETDSYPMQDTNCSFCPYHMVCKKDTERQEMLILNTQFKKSHWDFMKGESE